MKRNIENLDQIRGKLWGYCLPFQQPDVTFDATCHDVN